MDEDKLKQLIAAALTFGALSIPGFSEWLHSVGGQAEVLILTGSLWKVIHLTVDWLHARGAAPAAKVSAVILALVLVPSFAWAQDAPAQPDRGGILATYSLAHMAPSMGRIALEADVRIAGTPLLFLGHVSEDGAGVGPQVRHDVGSVTLFGHTLIGSFTSGMDATRESGLRHGGGVEVPIRDGLVLRVGFDRTTAAGMDPVVASSVGFGWRF